MPNIWSDNLISFLLKGLSDKLKNYFVCKQQSCLIVYSTNMAGLQPKFISSVEVEKLLTWPLVNEAVEQALKAVAQSVYDLVKPLQAYSVQTTRSMTPCGDSSKLLICMPGFVGNYELSVTSDNKKNTVVCKLGTSFSTNQYLKPPLPNISAHILLFDEQTGHLQCIMDGTHITAWRTAAASIVATKYLYF